MIDLKSFGVATLRAPVLHSVAGATIRLPGKACSVTAVPANHAGPLQEPPDAGSLHQPLA